MNAQIESRPASYKGNRAPFLRNPAQFTGLEQLQNCAVSSSQTFTYLAWQGGIAAPAHHHHHGSKKHPHHPILQKPCLPGYFLTLPGSTLSTRDACKYNSKLLLSSHPHLIPKCLKGKNREVVGGSRGITISSKEHRKTNDVIQTCTISYNIYKVDCWGLTI